MAKKKSSKPRAPKQASEPVDPADELQDLLAQETKLAQQAPLKGSPTLTYRDEANVIVSQVFRAGALEERLGPDDLNRVMVETSAKLAHWLFARDLDLHDDPRHYLDKIEMLRNIYTQDWDRGSVSSGPAGSSSPKGS